MTIQVRYTEIFKQVMGMILIPTVLIFSFILVVLSLNKFHYSEILMNILIFGGTFIVIGISVLIILNVIITHALLEYDTTGLTITLLSTNLLFPQKQEILFSNLRQFSIDEDGNGRAFISIKTKSPKKSILLFPQVQDEPEEFLKFAEQLNDQITRLNQHSPDIIIEQEGFYEGRWMKGLAIAVAIIVILATVMKIYYPEHVTIWRLLLMYVVGIPFIFKVIQSRSKKND